MSETQIHRDISPLRGNVHLARAVRLELRVGRLQEDEDFLTLL